jgi:hypothetical protein
VSAGNRTVKLFFLPFRTHSKPVGCGWREWKLEPIARGPLQRGRCFEEPRLCMSPVQNRYEEVVKIAALASDPGLVGYECPACSYVTSVILQPQKPRPRP